MVYYPLSVLMLAGIDEVCIITGPKAKSSLSPCWATQPVGHVLHLYRAAIPDGLAQAYILAEEFLDGSPSAMVLGDNIFYGSGFINLLSSANEKTEGGTVFAMRCRILRNMVS